jgi:AcrR family transcriptional regulator
LSRDLILDAAESVASTDGPAALTVRAVAADLGAAPMAIYRYFATKEELLNALLDRVLGRFVPQPASGDWVDDLRRFAHAHRRLLDQHAWALAAFFSHPSPGPNATRVGEFALEILSRAPLDRRRAVAVFSGLLALNYGWSAFSSARNVQPEQAAEQVRQALRRLLPLDYPHTAAVAGDMAEYGSDVHYALVLELLLAGVQGAASAARD